MRHKKHSLQIGVRQFGSQGGKGKIWDSITKAVMKIGRFLKKSKILSTAGSLYAKSGLPYAEVVGKSADVASRLGYGKRRRRLKGKGLARAGGGLKRAGAGRRKKKAPKRKTVRRRLKTSFP
jgi:hypothetical protein